MRRPCRLAPPCPGHCRPLGEPDPLCEDESPDSGPAPFPMSGQGVGSHRRRHGSRPPGAGGREMAANAGPDTRDFLIVDPNQRRHAIATSQSRNRHITVTGSSHHSYRFVTSARQVPSRPSLRHRADPDFSPAVAVGAQGPPGRPGCRAEATRGRDLLGPSHGYRMPLSRRAGTIVPLPRRDERRYRERRRFQPCTPP